MSDMDFEQGFDEMEEAQGKDNVIKMEEPATKRRPFVLWTVAGNDYKLKLTASVICKLEQKYKRNLLLLITEEGLPPVATMLTIIQASMQLYNHGITYLSVQNVYDQYVDEGGDQNKLMSDVIMPLLGVSGFFTQNQMEILTEEMKDMDSAL